MISKKKKKIRVSVQREANECSDIFSEQKTLGSRIMLDWATYQRGPQVSHLLADHW